MSWGKPGAASASTDDCATELPDPPAPSGTTTGSTTQTSTHVNWNSLSGISKYRVEYRLVGSTSWSISSDTLTSPGHSVTGLVCGRDYQFRVSAYGDGSTYSASWSNPTSAVSGSTDGCDTELVDPTAPGSVSTSSSSRTQVTVSWSIVGGAAKYRVQYRRSSSSSWTTASSNVSGTTYVVTGLSCGRSYWFRVAAFGDGTGARAVWGPYSGEASRTTRSCSTPPPPPPRLPSAPAPGNVSVGEATDSGAPVSWDAVNGARHYRVQYRAGRDWWLEYGCQQHNRHHLRSNRSHLPHFLPIQGHGLW